MTIRPFMNRSDREALELLPWYVNRTLEGEERDTVCHALRSSITCRIEYERLRVMQALMRQDDAEHVASDRAFERLMARIASDAPTIRAPEATRRRRWPPVAQAAAVLAAAAGMAWWWAEMPTTGSDTYATLTADEPSAAHAPRLRLVFAEGVSEATRRAFLADHGLTLAVPLGADGIYQLSIPAAAEANELAERLRADPRIAIVTVPPASKTP